MGNKSDFLLKNFKNLTLLLLIAIAAISHDNLTKWNQLISGDGKGYYAYLPALFIYGDSSFDFVKETDEVYYTMQSHHTFMDDYKETKVNRYFSGVALLLFPFFLLAHILALIIGLPPDGYSPPYQYSVLAGAFFYLYLGLYSSQKVLRKLGIGEVPAVIAIVLIVLGTNLFYYSIHEPSMSHVYSFFAISFFCLSVLKFKESKNKYWILVTGFSLGIICLIRPTNIIVLFLLPFLAGSIKELMNLFKSIVANWKWTLGGTLLFMVVVLFQPLLWLWQTGYFIVRPYSGEGFNFLSPALWQVLFSFRKGLFIYTPLLLLSVAGFIFLLRKNKQRTVYLLLFLFIVIYYISSWWYWSYGMSFGHRAFIDFYLLFIFLLALLIQDSKRFGKQAVITFSLLFLILNQIQTYQYKNYILLWDDMTAERYGKVFLKTAFKYEGVLWNEFEELRTEEYPLLELSGNEKVLFTANTSFEESCPYWDITYNSTYKKAYEGQKSTYTNSSMPFSSTFVKPLNSEFKGKELILEISSKIWFQRIRTGAELVVAIESEGNVIYYEPVRLNSIIKSPRSWEDFLYRYKIPSMENNGNKVLKIYAWNNKYRQPVYFDNMSVRILESN